MVSAPKVVTEQMPTGYSLEEAFPNPFNSQTIIKYTVPIIGQVDFKLYDSRGRFIRQIFSGNKAVGKHQLTINANDLASGSYFVKLSTGNVELEREIVIVK